MSSAPPSEKRSLSLHSHQTSIALEPEFWEIIDAACAKSDLSFARFIAQIDDQRTAEKSPRGLASYLRVWALNALKQSQNS